jgi:hypothetical protein
MVRFQTTIKSIRYLQFNQVICKWKFKFQTILENENIWDSNQPHHETVDGDIIDPNFKNNKKKP